MSSIVFTEPSGNRFEGRHAGHFLCGTAVREHLAAVRLFSQCSCATLGGKLGSGDHPRTVPMSGVGLVSNMHSVIGCKLPVRSIDRSNRVRSAAEKSNWPPRARKSVSDGSDNAFNQETAHDGDYSRGGLPNRWRRFLLLGRPG